MGPAAAAAGERGIEGREQGKFTVGTQISRWIDEQDETIKGKQEERTKGCMAV